MWQQYISDQVVSDFEEANNCTVNISYMSDNADAVTRLTSGGGDQYDLIMTCDAYMESLIAGGYVEELDLSRIPNSSNINPPTGPPLTTASPTWATTSMWCTTPRPAPSRSPATTT